MLNLDPLTKAVSQHLLMAVTVTQAKTRPFSGRHKKTTLSDNLETSPVVFSKCLFELDIVVVCMNKT